MKNSRDALSWLTENACCPEGLEVEELDSVESALSRHATSGRGTLEAALVLLGIAFSLALGFASIAVTVLQDDTQTLASALWGTYGWLLLLVAVPAWMIVDGSVRELRALRALRELARLRVRRERRIRSLNRTWRGRRRLEKLRRSW
jgi:hypothetical protein